MANSSNIHVLTTADHAAGGKGKRTAKVLRQAVIEAAERVGRDGEGRDGLVGYLMFLATQHPKAFAPLLGRVLPLQIDNKSQGPVVVIDPTMTPREAADAYASTLSAVPGIVDPAVEVELGPDEYKSE